MYALPRRRPPVRGSGGRRILSRPGSDYRSPERSLSPEPLPATLAVPSPRSTTTVSLIARYTTGSAENVVALHLEYLELDTFHLGVLHLPSLEVLSLAHNRLTCIPRLCRAADGGPETAAPGASPGTVVPIRPAERTAAALSDASGILFPMLHTINLGHNSIVTCPEPLAQAGVAILLYVSLEHNPNMDDATLAGMLLGTCVADLRLQSTAVREQTDPSRVGGALYVASLNGSDVALPLLQHRRLLRSAVQDLRRLARKATPQQQAFVSITSSIAMEPVAVVPRHGTPSVHAAREFLVLQHLTRISSWNHPTLVTAEGIGLTLQSSLSCPVSKAPEFADPIAHGAARLFCERQFGALPVMVKQAVFCSLLSPDVDSCAMVLRHHDGCQPDDAVWPEYLFQHLYDVAMKQCPPTRELSPSLIEQRLHRALRDAGWEGAETRPSSPQQRPSTDCRGGDGPTASARRIEFCNALFSRLASPQIRRMEWKGNPQPHGSVVATQADSTTVAEPQQSAVLPMEEIHHSAFVPRYAPASSRFLSRPVSRNRGAVVAVEARQSSSPLLPASRPNLPALGDVIALANGTSARVVRGDPRAVYCVCPDGTRHSLTRGLLRWDRDSEQWAESVRPMSQQLPKLRKMPLTDTALHRFLSRRPASTTTPTQLQDALSEGELSWDTPTSPERVRRAPCDSTNGSGAARRGRWTVEEEHRLAADYPVDVALRTLHDAVAAWTKRKQCNPPPGMAFRAALSSLITGVCVEDVVCAMEDPAPIGIVQESGC